MSPGRNLNKNEEEVEVTAKGCHLGIHSGIRRNNER